MEVGLNLFLKQLLYLQERDPKHQLINLIREESATCDNSIVKKLHSTAACKQLLFSLIVISLYTRLIVKQLIVFC